MRRFVPALLWLALIAVGIIAIRTSPWRLHGWTVPLAFLLAVAASKIVAIVFAIRRSQAVD